MIEFNQIFIDYKPKEEYSIMKGITSESQRYFASIYKKVSVGKNKLGKDNHTETSIGNIATKDIEEYFKFLEPYIEKR